MQPKVRGVPPVYAFYQAVGAVADGRCKKEHGEFHVYNFSRNKYHTVKYDEEKNAIMCDDKQTFFKGWLGYPAISYLLTEGHLPYDKKIGVQLIGVHRSQMHTHFGDDYDMILTEIHLGRERKRRNVKHFSDYFIELRKKFQELNLVHLGDTIMPTISIPKIGR